MTKEIPLTKGMVALVDDDDFEYINQWKWYFNGKYATRNKPITSSYRVPEYMHRVIVNTPEGMDTDHINHNKLDNRKQNLRISTRAQNKYNMTKNSRNTSGYKGVSWSTVRNKWEVRISHNGKSFFVGRFSSLKNAADAYDNAAKTYHGEFAYLNFSKGN
jgi:hypothetical protein